MKKAALFFVFLTIASLALAQSSSFDYFRDVATRAGSVALVDSYMGYDFDGDCCLFGAFMSSGSTVGINYYFRNGVNYLIWGLGDSDVNDLDITMLDSNGAVITQDTQQDANPVVTFSCTSDGQRQINVKNYRSSDKSFVMFAVLSDRHIKQYTDTATKFSQAINTCLSVGEYANSIGNIGFFNDQICLMGGVLDSRTSSTYGNFVPNDSRNCVFITCGSDNVSDADVKVTQQSDINGFDTSFVMDDAAKIGEDTDTSNLALLVAYLNSTNYYCVKYRNYSSTAEGFIFTLVMGVR